MDRPPEPGGPLYLAWDGTLHADRLGHIALRLAAGRPERALYLLAVAEAGSGDLERRLEPLAAEARYLGLGFHPRILTGDVHDALVEALPPEGLLLCGMRASPKTGTWLSGTLAERLLREARRNVLALRLVQAAAGPARVLLPVAGRNPAGLLPLLPLLAPACIDVLRVMEEGPFERRDRLAERGRTYLDSYVNELRGLLRPEEEVHAEVVVGKAWPAEVVNAARRLRSELVLLGATDRLLAHLTRSGGGLEEVLQAAPCDVGVWRRGR